MTANSRALRMMPRRAERQDGGGGEEEDTTQGQTQEAFAPAPGCPPPALVRESL